MHTTEVYTPSPEEFVFIRENARGPSPTLTVAVLLKSMQRLGYLPRLQDVPFAVVAHIRSCLRLPPNTAVDVGARTLYRHHAAIRNFLQVRPWGPEARHVAISAVHTAAAVQDHPADLINVAIEELVRQRYELPAFSALDRLVQRVRTLVHARLFRLVLGRLSNDDQQLLDGLLHAEPPRRSMFDALNSHHRGHRCRTLTNSSPTCAGSTSRCPSTTSSCWTRTTSDWNSWV